jgi:ubiquitin carboxyl-terminal hydrolase 5/13
VQVWEEERKVSRYAESLPQLEAHRKISPNPKVRDGSLWGEARSMLSPASRSSPSTMSQDWRCEETGATENLWLNLSTGVIGSGRKVRTGKTALSSGQIDLTQE